MDFKHVIGWFALMLGVACLLGLAIALVSGVMIDNNRASQGPGTGLVFIAAVSFLNPVGIAAVVAGAIGAFWSIDQSAISHKYRCWFAMAAGAAAALVGVVYGVGA